MANVKIEKKGPGKGVTIFQPNDDQNREYSSPVISHWMEEGKHNVKTIKDHSIDVPRVIITYEDGNQDTYVGMPFIIRQKIEPIDEVEKRLSEIADTINKPTFKQPKL